MAMSKGLENLQDASFSTPMVKGKTFTLLYLVRLTPHRSFFVWFFHKSAASCLFLSGPISYNSAVQLSDQSTCSRGLQDRKAKSQHNGRASLPTKARRSDDHSRV
jgi:hypothetical protein